jgi:hypothetical protein
VLALEVDVHVSGLWMGGPGQAAGGDAAGWDACGCAGLWPAGSAQAWLAWLRRNIRRLSIGHFNPNKLKLLTARSIAAL